MGNTNNLYCSQQRVLRPESIRDGWTNINELYILTSTKYFQTKVGPGRHVLIPRLRKVLHVVCNLKETTLSN
jgi:hypothetical protein